MKNYTLNLVEKLTDAFNKLDEDEQIQLWNDYCEECNMMDDQAIPVDELEEYCPLSSFDSVSDVILMYSSVMNDTGHYICEYATFNGYGYLVPFDVDDIDVDALVNEIADGNLNNVLPDELQEVMDEEKEEDD